MDALLEKIIYVMNTFKFAPEILDNQIAMIINKTFENHKKF